MALAMADELDKLVNDGSGEVAADLAGSIQRIRAAAESSSTSLDDVQNAINDVMERMDHAANADVLGGVMTSSAALAAYHERTGTTLGDWPGANATAHRDYWLKASGWTPEMFDAIQGRNFAAAELAASFTMMSLAADAIEAAQKGEAAAHVHPDRHHPLVVVEHMADFVEKATEEGMQSTVYNLVDGNATNSYGAQSVVDLLDAEPEVVVIITKDDGKVRPNHLVHHLKAYSPDSPVLDAAYPPNGFGCRCKARGMTVKQAESMGATIVSSKRMPKGGKPDEGFSGRPDKAKFKPDFSRFPKSWRR